MNRASWRRCPPGSLLCHGLRKKLRQTWEASRCEHNSYVGLEAWGCTNDGTIGERRTELKDNLVRCQLQIDYVGVQGLHDESTLYTQSLYTV